jgi:hypothetical protein
MAEEGQSYGFRARMAQMFTALFGQRQQTQQQQIQKSDRQVADGFDRGADDPDNRRAVQQVQSSARGPMNQEPPAAPQQNAQSEGLRIAMEAAQRRFEAQQRTNTRQQGRGMGW